MKRVRESKFTAEVTRVMRARGAMIYPIVAGARGAEDGWPDRLVWSMQWRGLLEFKGVDTPMRPRQTPVMRDLNKRHPGSAYVVRDPGDGSGEVLIQDETGSHTLLRTTPDRLVWDLAALNGETTDYDPEDLE